jgi:hypothetical protein
MGDELIVDVVAGHGEHRPYLDWHGKSDKAETFEDKSDGHVCGKDPGWDICC